MVPVRFLLDANQAGKQRKKMPRRRRPRALFSLSNESGGRMDRWGPSRVAGGEQETRDREMRTHGTASVANIGG